MRTKSPSVPNQLVVIIGYKGTNPVLDNHEGVAETAAAENNLRLGAELGFSMCFSRWHSRHPILHEIKCEGVMIKSRGKQRCIEPDEKHQLLVFYNGFFHFHGHPVVFCGGPLMHLLVIPGGGRRSRKGGHLEEIGALVFG